MIHSDWQPARIKSRNSLLKLSEAKEIFAPTDCVDTFPQLSHHSSDSRHVKHGFLLVHKPTLNSHSQTYPNLCRSPTLNRASPKKNLRCRFFFFYEPLFVVKWKNIFIGRVHWRSSYVGLYKAPQTSCSLFPHCNSPVPAQAECRALPGKFTSPSTLWSVLKNESFHSKRF